MLSLSNICFGQLYDDYLGAGNNIGISVSGSTPQQTDSTSSTISGTQLKPDMIGASRFLSQAALGASYEDMTHVTNIGIDAWLEEQFNMPVLSFATKYNDIYNETQQIVTNDFHASRYTAFTFYDFVLKQPDVLRQKVAFALSQIFVVTPFHDSALEGDGTSNMTYYDFLYQGAFGNYKDILTKVSLSVPMGNYLSHFRNQKADIIEKTYPDENYAREIMQLFSIGLNMLNLDGSLILDANGNSVPTYNIDNIAEMAKIFTGLGVAYTDEGLPNNDFNRTWSYDKQQPMKMFDDFHSKGEKNILPGVTISAGQSGMTDINQTLDVLFNHQNVGPFISKRLIQHLVKSNPSNSYVRRISTIFNNNGKGVRGDLKAVVQAILLDPEARDCNWIDNPNNGKLIQPVERFITLFKAFKITTPSGRYWFDDFYELFDETGQSFFSSPSVFNFYSPFYAEDEYIAPQNLLSPEFQILNSVTAIAYINEMEDAIKIRPFKNRTMASENTEWLEYNPEDEAFLDFSEEIIIYNTQGVNALLERLDLLLCRGQLGTATKALIANAIQEFEANSSSYDSTDAVKDAIYFTMMSPNYIIQK